MIKQFELKNTAMAVALAAAFAAAPAVAQQKIRVGNLNDFTGATSSVGKISGPGKIDAFATNKATLFEMSEKLPGSKVLDGRWGAERHAIGIPKGRDAGLAFVRQFTETAKADGIVKSAMSRAGLRGAVVAESR